MPSLPATRTSKANAADCYTGAVRPLVILTLTLAALAGCAATQEAGRPFPAEARGQLVLDRTPRAEALRLFGVPVTTTPDARGRERWTYEHTRISAQRAVPFGRRVSVRQTPYEQLVLTFEYGLLSECVYLVERYRTEDTLIVADGVTREPCGRAAP